MAYKEIYYIFGLVANDKHIRLSAIVVTIFSITLSIFFSPLTGLVSYSSYIFGYAVCWIFIQYQNIASTFLHSFISFCYGGSPDKQYLKNSCSICDDLSCKRHQQGKSGAPWKNLFIQKDLNEAIEEFYNKILENFVGSWYNQFTNDADFVNELRYCLRYASSLFIKRFFEIDHGKIIANKLLPCAIKHVDDYMYMQQIVKLKNSRLNDVIVEYLGKRLHAAATNRKYELGYLQHLSANLMPHVLPEKYMQSKNYAVLIREILAGWVLLPLMDVLADPNIINSLVILAATYRTKKYPKTKDNNDKVEFLMNFIVTSEKSSFAVDLDTIRKNTDLLYAFMKFLKNEEHVHLLQFCLDMEEFNNKLLTPDPTKKQLEDLHSDAVTLYNEYLNKDSLNFIGCSEEIIEGVYSSIKYGVYGVAKLRTSKPIYQAYEHTLDLLEKIWLPSFFHSNEFYHYICGSKITAGYNKTSFNRSPLFNIGSPMKTRTKKYYEPTSQGTVAKISSGLVKIKGALRNIQPVEGAIFPSEPQTIENGTVEDIIPECVNIFRDLSAWRISILSYQTTNKIISFCIDVRRLDAVDESSKRHWIVLRRDQDFYTLKAKLVEFHGENEICDSPFPSRKAGSTIEARMSKYEDFLKKLLQKPSLRGSDLLYTFLTAEQDFTTLISQNVQDVGNIYQSVAHKLRKEKGQHLDSFMSTYLQSIGKSKQGKFEWAEIGDELDNSLTINTRNVPFPKTYRNHIFNDNFGIQFKNLENTSSGSFNPMGVTQCFFYLLKYVFKVPYYILRLYAAICSVAYDAVESFSEIFIERKLRSSLSPINLTYLIKLLQEVIFSSHTPPTKQELEERKVRAFVELRGIIPQLVVKATGASLGDGLCQLLEVLQHPHYNKHLMYNLFDLILIEMYPTLGQS